MKDTTIPKEVLETLGLKEPESPTKTVGVIFDKGQAIVRIPTYFNDILGIVKGSKFKISVLEKEKALKLELISE